MTVIRDNRWLTGGDNGLAVRTGLTGWFLCLYLFTLSWSGAFRISEWVPINFVPLLSAYIAATMAMVGGARISILVFDWRDCIVALFLLLILLAGVLTPTDKTGNYVLAYFFVFGFQYLLLKPFIARFVNIHTLFNVNSWAVLVVGGYCVVEFFTYWLLGVDIQDFVPRSKDASATYNQIFGRSYGFSTEPTQVAFYLDTLGPLAIWNISRWNLKFKPAGIKSHYVLYGIIGLGWMSTLSAAAVVIVAVTLFLTGLLVWRPKITYARILTTILLLAVAVVGLTAMIDAVFWFYGDIFDKILFRQDTGSLSVSQRGAGFSRGLERVLSVPLAGIGLGATSVMNEDSTVNWYLFLASEAGILAPLTIMVFIGLQVLRVMKDRHDALVPFFFGIFAGGAHLATVSTFQNANLWVLLALYGCYDGFLREREGHARPALEATSSPLSRSAR